MMDHERTERELQEVFEEIQRSYEALVNNALEAQKQTLELAHSLYKSSAEAQSQSTRATLGLWLSSLETIVRPWRP